MTSLLFNSIEKLERLLSRVKPTSISLLKEDSNILLCIVMSSESRNISFNNFLFTNLDLSSTYETSNNLV